MFLTSSSTRNISKIPMRPLKPLPLQASQPTGCMTRAWASMPGSICRALISYSDKSPGCLHFGQSLLTRRWATTARTELDTRKGFTPISTSRAIALGASFVWRVERTRWPVSEALTAMLAVSLSRISPIIIMFGAWRRIERSATGNVMPMLTLTGTWLMPFIWYSTGSSTVMSLRSGLFI